MKHIRHLIISAIALCSLSTPSFCLGEKLLGAKIQNAFTWGAPDDVAKNPKQSAAYLDSLNENIEELRTKYQTFMSTDELTATIRGNQTKTKQHIERKKKWNETTAVYGLRNARLTTERPELIDAAKLIAEGEKQEKKLRTRSKKLGFKPGLKKAEEKIKEFKGRLEKANIADTTTSATTGLTGQQIQDKATLLRKELEEAFKYNRTVATDILGFNLAAKTEDADTLYFSPLSSKDKAWIKKIQEQATLFFNKVQSNAEDKKKLLDESVIRDMYKKLWDTQESGTQIDLKDPAVVYARLVSTDGPLSGTLPGNISDIITTYNEIDFETRLSTAVVDSMAGQCKLLNKNQPAPSKKGESEADLSAVPLILSSGWLNNVQTYIAGYQDLAVLAGLGIYSARGAVQDIQKQVEAAIKELNSYLQITEGAPKAADSSGAGEGGSSTATSAPKESASTKAARKATVEKVHTAYSNLSADKKKSVKELCQKIETTLRALHNQYQRLLNGNRIIALKAELILPTFDYEDNIVRSKQKHANQTTRDTGTITTARTEFKAAKTKLYDLLAMIQAVRSGSFTKEDKKAIVERPKTLANLFFIMDHEDEDQNDRDIENENDGTIDEIASRYSEKAEIVEEDATGAIADHASAQYDRERNRTKTNNRIRLAASKREMERLSTPADAPDKGDGGNIQDLLEYTRALSAEARSIRAATTADALQSATASTNPMTLLPALEAAAETAEEEVTTDGVTTAKERSFLDKIRGLLKRITERVQSGRSRKPKTIEIAPRPGAYATRGDSGRTSVPPMERQDGSRRLGAPSSSRNPSGAMDVLAELSIDFTPASSGGRPKSPQRLDDGAGEMEIEMTTPSSYGVAERTGDDEEEEGAASGPAALGRLTVEGNDASEGDSERPAAAEVQKKKGILSRLLRALRRTKTADELEAAAPERAQEIATGLIETPDLNKDGRTDAQEQEVADKATGFLASIKAWFKNVTGAAKKPVASEEMDPGYVYEIINPTIGRPTGTGDSINFIRTEKEIAELWYKAPRSFVVKLAMPTENRYGSKGRLQKYITMKMIEDSRNDNQTITLVHDKEGSSSETEFILSGMTKLNIKITSVVSEDAATTDASSDDSGAAEGTSPDSFITFPQDIPLAIFNPRTSNFETEYFKYLTCTSDDGNDVEPSEITSIDISAKEPQSLRPRAENQNEHITITIFFTDNTIYQQDIKSSNLEVSSKTLRITLGDERISNTNPTKISSRQHRVYPNLGTNWDTKLTPKKTLRIPKDGPAAGRNVSDNEDPESRGRSSSLGRQITETTADPFAS